MNPQVFGPEHLTYVIVSLLVAAVLVFEYDEPNRKKQCSKRLKHKKATVFTALPIGI